jgi:hypothetical protein
VSSYVPIIEHQAPSDLLIAEAKSVQHIHAMQESLTPDASSVVCLILAVLCQAFVYEGYGSMRMPNRTARVDLL